MTIQLNQTRPQTILNAALEAFSAHGYADTSIGHICATAPCSVGSFYHHFHSKEGVAAALYESAVDGFQAGLLAALEQPLEPRSMVSVLVRSHLTWARDNELWSRYMLQMGAAPATAMSRPSVTAKNRSLLDAVTEWSRHPIEAGLIADLPASALLAQILGPSYFITKAWLAGGAEITESLIDRFAVSAWQAVAMIGAPSASRLR